MVRKKTFVTSLMHSKPKKGKVTIRNANIERISVIKQLAQKGKKVVLVVPKNIDPIKDPFVKQVLQLGKNIRIMKVSNDSIYLNYWQRDVFTRLVDRFYNRDRAQDVIAKVAPHLQRYFGEGGRVINLGNINGKPSVILSNSVQELGISNNAEIQTQIMQEIQMLKRRGFNVFELSGFNYSPYGRKGKPSLKREFF